MSAPEQLDSGTSLGGFGFAKVVNLNLQKKLTRNFTSACGITLEKSNNSSEEMFTQTSNNNSESALST